MRDGLKIDTSFYAVQALEPPCLTKDDEVIEALVSD